MVPLYTSSNSVSVSFAVVLPLAVVKLHLASVVNVGSPPATSGSFSLPSGGLAWTVHFPPHYLIAVLELASPCPQYLSHKIHAEVAVSAAAVLVCSFVELVARFHHTERLVSVQLVDDKAHELKACLLLTVVQAVNGNGAEGVGGTDLLYM